MPGRLLRSADFERVLGAPACARSPHFAIHYLPERPGKPRRQSASTELSTAHEQISVQVVDDSPAAGPGGIWLGVVVPKRHARRSVTRNLLKRQIRAALARREGAAGLPPGLWVVRLRAPFDRAEFVSAASPALRRAARDELDALLLAAGGRLAGGIAR